MLVAKFLPTAVLLVALATIAAARSMESRQHGAEKQDYQPGLEKDMIVKPIPYSPFYKPAGKLLGKVALITGGDSGIGWSVAIHYCLEGPDVAIACLPEEMEDAAGNSTPLSGRSAVKQMKRSDVVINTASIGAYRGSKGAADYSASEGAVVAFTRSLSSNLVEKGIRVNAVAPGPLWTPLIPGRYPQELFCQTLLTGVCLILAAFQTAENVAQYGMDAPMKRPGEICELGPAYVFLASFDSS
ncbi:hypothetical protein RvY_01413 [Ramazzottius varieornatus]|uniref:NAD(P)-binding protein n=1 Tax=Ramazzottius varieornatus TaxID=947166 RepID=A0A1D1URH3_RAMVA|nr:hypothetical protein RvY_01413 [Ramazzottius varieornatus]